MNSIINESTRANNSYWFSSRVFGAYISYVSLIIISAGIFAGVKYSKNPVLYGVSIVFLLQLTEYVQWIAREIVNM
jgi:hypothetical protein